MVQHSVVFLILALLCGTGLAQDERYYRQILTGELPKVQIPLNETPMVQFNVQGNSYRIDLNGDGFEESLTPQKRDGVDWIELRDPSERIIFESKLLAMGGGSSIYKVKLVNISKTVKALIVFLDEGQTQGRKFESTARIYVLSYENNDLSRIQLSQGPHMFHEKEAQREQYFRRDYQVNVYDVNNDGTREITVEYNHIQRIMKYEKGSWVRF